MELQHKRQQMFKHFIDISHIKFKYSFRTLYVIQFQFTSYIMNALVFCM